MSKKLGKALIKYSTTFIKPQINTKIISRKMSDKPYCNCNVSYFKSPDECIRIASNIMVSMAMINLATLYYKRF